jgi:hypothetical protein
MNPGTEISHLLVMKKYLIISAFILPLISAAQVQDTADILKQLGDIQPELKRSYTKATFKSTMLINAHSVESLGKGELDVKIAHRFGTLNTGFYEIFGLDNATLRMGVDYGITDRIMIGAGRSSFEKQYDGFIKWKILRQTEGKGGMPVSLSVLAGMYINTLKWSDPSRENYFRSRLDYVFQVMVARKFSEGFSLQVSPTVVHRNLVPESADKNDILAIGIGGRQKITKRATINAEYYYQLPGTQSAGTVNALSLGFDIETGGHVFQFMFTNSTGIAENQYIAKTTGKWNKGDIHFGFNIRRVFTLGRKKAGGSRR